MLQYDNVLHRGRREDLSLGEVDDCWAWETSLRAQRRILAADGSSRSSLFLRNL